MNTLDVNDPRDYYAILGVPNDAPPAEIKRSYHRLAKQLHPDKNPGTPEKFQEIQHAYSVLADPRERQRYDHYRDLCGQLKNHTTNINAGDSSGADHNQLAVGVLCVLLGAATIAGGVSGGFVFGSAGFLVLSTLSTHIGIVPTLVVSMPLTSCFLQLGFHTAVAGTYAGLRISFYGLREIVEYAGDCRRAITCGISRYLHHLFYAPECEPDNSTAVNVKIVEYDEEEFVFLE